MSRQPRITPDRAVLIGLLLTAAVYCRDLQYDFILDDVPLILMNTTIASWHNWKLLFIHHIFFAPGPEVPVIFTALHYRPVYMLWLMANQSLFGAIVPWWHLTSLLLHICAILLTYRLAATLLLDRWTAALAALLFAFHPLHLESVSYVSASTDLLVTVFLLASLLCYIEYRRHGASPGYLLVSVIAAALAMLSKESAAMYPFALVAYEVMSDVPSGLARTWRRFIYTLPFFAVVGAYVAVRTVLFGPTIGQGPGGSRLAALLDAPLVLMVYLQKFLWPWRLSFFYPIEWFSQWTLLKGAATVLIAVTLAFLWHRYRERRAVQLQLLWSAILFASPLLAVTTFVREDWVHDRHMYLVSVPLCILLATVLMDLKMNVKFPRQASLVAIPAILIALLAATSLQLTRFSNAGTLYAATLKVAPRNVLAHRYRAFALWTYGNYDEAFQEFQLSVELAPRDSLVRRGYGLALASRGRNDEALAQYAQALLLSVSPTVDRADILYRMATIELMLSKSDDAVTHMREAVRIAPETGGYQATLAQALLQQQRQHEAERATGLQASAAPEN